MSITPPVDFFVCFFLFFYINFSFYLFFFMKTQGRIYKQENWLDEKDLASILKWAADVC